MSKLSRTVLTFGQMDRTDNFYMQRCLDLAAKGLGATKTNPLVGSVIVKNGEIIGEGYHQKFGEAHAEVNAIKNVANEADLLDSTLYVNLEPCAHFGKTPPCSNLIIEKKIPRVVIGALDTFSEVNGKGIEKMRAAGVDVKVGVLEKECRELNKRFYTNVEKKRPYIILKCAKSSDGFMDPIRENGERGIHWITQPETQKITHQWRAEEMGILVGKNTVLNDNPSLTTRAVEGPNPVRIAIDPKASLHSNYAVFNEEATTYHLVGKLNSEVSTNQVLLDEFSPKSICEKLIELGLSSIIIEGGGYTLRQFIEAGLWDEARILTGQNKMNAGLMAPEINGILFNEIHCAGDLIQFFRNGL